MLRELLFWTYVKVRAVLVRLEYVVDQLEVAFVEKGARECSERIDMDFLHFLVDVLIRCQLILKQRIQDGSHFAICIGIRSNRVFKCVAKTSFICRFYLVHSDRVQDFLEGCVLERNVSPRLVLNRLDRVVESER